MKMRLYKVLLVVSGMLLSVFALNCAKDIEQEPIPSMMQTVFDPDSGEIPFPNDVLYKVEVEGYDEGQPKDVGHINFPKTGIEAMDAIIEGLNTLDGFSAWVPPYFQVRSYGSAQLDPESVSKESVLLFGFDRDVLSGIMYGISQGKTLDEVMQHFGYSSLMGLLVALDPELPSDIPYTVEYDAQSGKINIVPLAPLTEHKQYMVVVVSGRDSDGNVVGLRDTNGNPVEPAPLFYMLRQDNPLCVDGKSTTSLIEDDELACEAESMRLAIASIVGVFEQASSLGDSVPIPSFTRDQIALLWMFRTETATAPLAGLAQGAKMPLPNVDEPFSVNTQKAEVLPSEIFGSDKTSLDTLAVAYKGTFKGYNFLLNDTGDGYATFKPSEDSPIGIEYEATDIPFVLLVSNFVASPAPKQNEESETEAEGEFATETEFEFTEAESEVAESEIAEVSDGDYDSEMIEETEVVAEYELEQEAEPEGENEELPSEYEEYEYETYEMESEYPTVKGVIIFAHGLGGSKEDVYRFAHEALHSGFAVVAIDLPFFGERTRTITVGDSTVELGIFSPNLFATRDNIRQAVLDLVQLVSSIQNRTNGIGSLIGELYSENDNIGFVGISLGGIIGGVLAGVEDRISSYVLSAPGAGWPKILLETEDEGIRDPLIDALASVGINEGTPQFEQFMGITGWVLEQADPVMFLKHAVWKNELFDGQKPRAILVQMMQDDPTIPNSTTQLLISAGAKGDTSWLEDAQSASCTMCQAFVLDPDDDLNATSQNGLLWFSVWAKKDGDEFGKHSFLTADETADQFYQMEGHEARQQAVKFISTTGSEL